MKLLTPFVLLAICATCSCNKARDLATKLGDQLEQSAPDEIVSEISEKEFKSFTQQPDVLVVVDFYADWCGPCRQLSPILETIAKEHKGAVRLGKINVDNAKELATREGVSSIPDVRIFRNGTMVDKFVGAPPETEVRRRIDRQIRDEPETTGKKDGKDGKTDKKEPAIKPMDKDWLPKGIERK